MTDFRQKCGRVEARSIQGKWPLASRNEIDYPLNMAATAYRYLVKHPGVSEGKTIIESTPIAVHDVIDLLQNGETLDSVGAPHCFQDITKAQVYECLAYYEDHRTEIDALLIE
ncbi:MAG: DUF433 domain-containing protein [Chthoniobacteraceae bacterium]